MTGRILIIGGVNYVARRDAARFIASENHWPVLSDADLAGAPPATLLRQMWAQVDAGVPNIVVTGDLRVTHETWVDELNYDLGLRGYEATVVYLLAEGEGEPPLAPEHHVLDHLENVEDLLTATTALAKFLA